MPISYEEFEKVDLRSGTVIKVEPFPRAKKPAYKVWVDFGPDIGVKQTSAQVTVHYTLDSLMNRQVVDVLILAKKILQDLLPNFYWLAFLIIMEQSVSSPLTLLLEMAKSCFE